MFRVKRSAFLFLHQPIRLNAPMPVAKSGSAAGSGVTRNAPSGSVRDTNTGPEGNEAGSGTGVVSPNKKGIIESPEDVVNEIGWFVSKTMG
jgi:hypothetical protein